MPLRRVAATVLFACLTCLPLRAEPPAILLEALRKSGAEAGRWAYTETSIEKDEKGRSEGETVVRFDPSKPPAEQFTPLKINGKPPTAKQLKEYRKRGVDLFDGKDVPSNAPLEIDGSMLDLDRAKVLSDTAGVLSYEIPLKAVESGLAVDKFQVTVRIQRELRALERLSLTIVKPVRMMLVAKVSGGTMHFDYTTQDAGHAPVLTTTSGTFNGTIFFVKGGITMEEKRTDFQWVKPYDERGGVKIGPLKSLPQ